MIGMSSAHLFQLGSEHVADTSDDWYTPRSLFQAIGLVFDVAAPVQPERRTCPARGYLTVLEDGLTAPWEGLVWMNPPYSGPGLWVDRFMAHREGGLALLPAHNSAWLQRLLPCVDALAILDVEFSRPDGVTGHMRWPSLLMATGTEGTEAVRRAAPMATFRIAN